MLKNGAPCTRVSLISNTPSTAKRAGTHAVSGLATQPREMKRTASILTGLSPEHSKRSDMKSDVSKAIHNRDRPENAVISAGALEYLAHELDPADDASSRPRLQEPQGAGAPGKTNLSQQSRS